jgi:phosphatidylserine/phosphatidylglycerophosphate/cardiolipin synthase-like enzyme
MWSREIAALFASALRREPDLRVIVVVPRFPDRNGVVSGPPHRLAQLELIDRLRTEADGRFAIYDLENDVGIPIYVHAKTVVIDDVWAAVGSDNLTRRSWTHDSELSIGVLDSQHDARTPADPAGLGDGARVFARDLRLQLLREHTGLGSDDRLLDPSEAFEAVRDAADALDAWHREGEHGPRPPGQLRNHHLSAVRWWESWWADPLYRTLVDPDGRPRKLKRRHAY